MRYAREDIIRRLGRLLPRSLSTHLPRRIAAVPISEVRSRTLNRRYRRQARPANILSLRYGSAYGELLFCPALIRREARRYGNSYDFQLTWMLLHGMIHLAGLHHEKSPAVAKRVSRLERRILGVMWLNRKLKMKKEKPQSKI